MTFIDKQIKQTKTVVDKNKDIKEQLPKTMIEIISTEEYKQNFLIVTYTKYSNISYNELVNGLVRDKYSESEEFAILRKAMTNLTDEFNEYNTYVEQCKIQAKEWINQRDGVSE